jgi:Fe-S cluster assembly ATP-binding protein
VLYNGRIVRTGTKELALELEEKGYDWLKKEADMKLNGEEIKY